MPSGFAEIVGKDLSLSDFEIAVIRKSGIRNAEELDALVRAYPSLNKLGLPIPRLSNYATQRLGNRYAATVAQLAKGQIRTAMSRGAKPPSGTPWDVGAAVPVPTASGTGATGAPPPTPPTGRINLHVPGWTIRD